MTSRPVVLKTSAELAAMRKAGRLAAETIRLVAEGVKPGATTADLDRLAERHIRRGGGVPSFKNYRGYPASICASVNDEVVHGIPSRRVLHDGMIVSIDLGVLLDGFHADTATTVPVGVISAETRRLIEVANAALEAGVSAARPGATLGDLAWAIQSVIESAGFSAVRDFAGHGIGRVLHEELQVPNVGRPGTGLKLRPGMTLAIEPMVNMGGPEVYIDADGWTVRTRDHSLSAHTEHTVAITTDGPDVLTRLSGTPAVY